MPFKLENKQLVLEIQEPGEVYRGARFDWTGQIVQVIYLDKHTFCTTETRDINLINEKGRGLYNEFGIDLSIGYESCLPGEEFPKIGVGQLTKTTEKPYDFFVNYPIKPYNFNLRIEKNYAEFICNSKTVSGYGFKLVKRIALEKNSFKVRYTLSNTGDLPIITNEYIHNFLSINNRDIDENYKLIFPFELKPQKFKESVNPENIVKFKNDTIYWDNNPSGQFFFSEIQNGLSQNGKWILIHEKEKAGISETTDFKLQRINLWGDTHVVSPEIFVKISLLPGRTAEWTRTFSTFITE